MTDTASGPSRPLPPTVAAEVLALTVAAAAELADRGFPVTAPGIVTITFARQGLEVASVVREHLIEAGIYGVKT